MDALVAKYGCSLDTPWQDMPAKLQKQLLYGTGTELNEFGYENMMGQFKVHKIPFEGIMNILDRRYRESDSDTMREEYENYMSISLCPECHGARLKPEVLAVTVGGRNIQQVTELPVRDCRDFFNQVDFTERERVIGRQVLKEINARLGFLVTVGLEYLTLSRAAGTLSGGEAQRIRLATQIGSGLVGVLYILDEPSIGLHQRDNNKLLEALQKADCVPLKTIEELRDIAYGIVGEPEKVEFGDRVVGIIEARDGTIMDVVREVKPFSFRED